MKKIIKLTKFEQTHLRTINSNKVIKRWLPLTSYDASWFDTVLCSDWFFCTSISETCVSPLSTGWTPIWAIAFEFDVEHAPETWSNSDFNGTTQSIDSNFIISMNWWRPAQTKSLWLIERWIVIVVPVCLAVGLGIKTKYTVVSSSLYYFAVFTGVGELVTFLSVTLSFDRFSLFDKDVGKIMRKFSVY